MSIISQQCQKNFIKKMYTILAFHRNSKNVEKFLDERWQVVPKKKKNPTALPWTKTSHFPSLSLGSPAANATRGWLLLSGNPGDEWLAAGPATPNQAYFHCFSSERETFLWNSSVVEQLEETNFLLNIWVYTKTEEPQKTLQLNMVF